MLDRKHGAVWRMHADKDDIVGVYMYVGAYPTCRSFILLEIVSLIDWVLLKASLKGWQCQDWSGKYLYRTADDQELFHGGSNKF